MAEAHGRERGVALLVAMLATALLTVTVLEFTYSTQVAYRRAAHWLESKRARLAAESGVALAAEVLSFDGELAELLASGAAPPSDVPLLGGIDPRVAAVDGMLDFWARCSEPTAWTCTTTVDQACTWPIAGPAGDAFGARANSAEPQGFFTVRIEDETGLYNLNRLLSHAVPNEFERVARLFRIVSVDPTLVGPIVDWIDADDVPTAFPPGAERSLYLSENREPGPRNAAMGTFRELALIMGVDHEQMLALRRVATVLPAPADKVNVNTAPLPVLESLSDNLADESLLVSLQAQRCLRPFLDDADLRTRVPGIEATGMLPLLTYRSSWFRVRATGRAGDVFQAVEAILFREGADVRIVYFLGSRGTNIAGVDTPSATGFENRAPFSGR